jgi:predicted GNAT family acetyltransferase
MAAASGIGLDRPVWASLTTHHAPLSTGGPRARRYRADVNLFASAWDESPESLAALSALLRPGETVFVMQVPEIVPPPGLTLVKRARGVQMVAAQKLAAAAHRLDIRKLGDGDAPDMLALAQLTEPGPFLARTQAMGDFIGLRIGGRLVAMAGERLRFPGHTEVSAVCTHPDFRGRGFARALTIAIAAQIQARGEAAFLHAWATNRPAIALYESLGFAQRAEVDVAVVTRAG